MNLLDGKKISKEIKSEIYQIVNELKNKSLRVPHLVTILVGDNPSSASYIKSKIKACHEVGFKSTNVQLEKDVSQNELLSIISDMNNNSGVDGFIVQLPLPDHLDEMSVIEAIDPSKDVDGFHPINLGKLLIGSDTFIPATPYGILELIKRYKIETAGKEIVVLGRSNIVGKPISICLMQKNYPGDATVTVLHSRSKNIKERLLQADIIVAAIGKPNFVTADMVKNGAVVIDVGINSIPDNSGEKLYKLVGDVDFINVAPKCSYITPVPGGVGLMTVACLLSNTLKAYKNFNEKK